MKRTACLFVACLLLLSCIAAAAETANTPLAPAPSTLLDEACNPFYNMPQPEGYTVADAGCYLTADIVQYTLALTTKNAMDDVIAFAASLLPGAGVNEMQAAMNLMSGGVTDMQGTYEGLPALFRITDRQYKNGGFAGDRFLLEMTVELPVSQAYTALFENNLQYPVFAEIGAVMPLANPDESSLRVWPDSDRAEMYIGYPLPDAAAIRDALLAAFPDQYFADNDWLVWRVGEIQIVVGMSEADSGRLYLLINFPGIGVSLLDYVPENTLELLGFSDFREPSAKCTLQDNDAGVWISISKDKWGENENTGERNAITFMTRQNDTFVLVLYSPATQTYSITVDANGEQARYHYSAADGLYLDDMGNSDMAKAQRVVTNAFLAPGETVDDVLALPMLLLEGYAAQALGCTLDELYALDFH